MDDLIKDTLGGLLEKLGLAYTGISVDSSDDSMIRVDIDSNEASRIIGWHGETVNAIQHLLKAIIRSQQKLDKPPFIVLDVDGYRRAQEDKVIRMAVQKADFVRRKKTRVALPPMSPYFRRVVHMHIANEPDLQDLTTESVGQGDYRQIVLRLKEGEMDDGEELSPVIENDSEELKPITEEDGGAGFDNLDI